MEGTSRKQLRSCRVGRGRRREERISARRPYCGVLQLISGSRPSLAASSNVPDRTPESGIGQIYAEEINV